MSGKGCLIALICFALAACAEADGLPSVKNISVRAIHAAPCALKNDLAYDRAQPALLVCADNDGKGLIWKIAGLEVPIAERAIEGTSCENKAGQLALDDKGTILYCGDEDNERVSP